MDNYAKYIEQWGNAFVECNRMATVGCLNSPRYPKATHN